MKVAFLKQHNEYREGDVVEVADGLGNYLLSVGAAKATTAKEKKAEAAPLPKAEAAPEVKEKRPVRDMDSKNAVEKVKDQKPGEKKKDSGPLEPVVNSKPDKDEVVNSTIETSEK
jgi:ribosomal protein L9